jgi:hypothetical protein
MKLNKQQHEAFAKFFEAPTREGLRDVLKQNIGETDYLDFKREWPEFPKLAKHVLALGNSGGGALIVGVEQEPDGSVKSVGVPAMLDKVKLFKGIRGYIPDSINADLFDFTFKDSEYDAIKGMSFQVLIVEFDSRIIPLLATRSGDGIRDNAIYIRKGTSSEEANHTGFSNTKTLKLNEHIEQLQVVNKSRRVRGGYNESALASITRWVGEAGSSKDYYQFMDELYEQKKTQIRKELGLQGEV